MPSLIACREGIWQRIQRQLVLRRRRVGVAQRHAADQHLARGEAELLGDAAVVGHVRELVRFFKQA